MQIILLYHGKPEDYREGAHHKFVGGPRTCPHCHDDNSVQALGYYHRGISPTGTGRILTIVVRRFRCLSCGKTVSYLPSFAHPYRLIQVATIGLFFSRHYTDSDVVRWMPLLRRYWSRFESWYPDLTKIAGISLGLSPPHTKADVCWNQIASTLGGASHATVHLVTYFQVTILGQYRCHRPNAKS